MYGNTKSQLQTELAAIREAGLYKEERIITTPQGAVIATTKQPEVLNFCANNYLGLSSHPAVIKAAAAALKSHGFGMSSVRFICGTQDIHKTLERKIADFLGMEDTILYAAAFDANGGLFEPLLGEQDCIISDELNHASIIDGIRLSKAKRLRYDNGDMSQLEMHLKGTQDARTRLIVTDGVFSMDGTIARLREICDLADRYSASVVVDDSHATGFMGATGRGTHEHCGVMGRVDILTGTLGKALGGASGGFVSGRAPVVGWLRQRSRPYLFSNTIAPVVAATTIRVLEMLEATPGLRRQLTDNAAWFRERLTALGFQIPAGEHPIIPVMLGDATLAGRMAERLLELGVYAIGFSYPVVPMGKARIRTQMCAGQSRNQLESAVAAFAQAGRELGIIRA